MIPVRTRWRTPSRPALAGAALLLLAALAGGAVVGTAQPDAGVEPVTETGNPLGPPLPGRAEPLPQAATVTLVTGDKVRVETSTNGQQDIEVVDAANDAFGGPAVQFSWGGDRFVVPAEAAPYLGGVLDPQLFNVSYLVRAKLDDANNQALPVSIKQAGGRAGDLPAVRVASVANETAAAAVTKAEAGSLGTRLGSLWRDSLAGGSSTKVGQVPGIERISLAPPRGGQQPPEVPITRSDGRPTPGTETATARYRTVTLNPIDRDGRPAVAVGFMHHLEDPRKFAMLVATQSAGPVSFSAPEGDYAIQFSVLSGPVEDRATYASLVLEPEVSVTSDLTVDLDARRAVPYRTSVEPAEQPGYWQDRLSYTRVNDAYDGSVIDRPNVFLEMRLLSGPRRGGHTLYATPTEPVTKGRFELLGYTSYSDTEISSVNSRYLFLSRWEGAVPASLTTVVPRSGLTPVHSTMYDSLSGRWLDPRSLVHVLTPLSRTLFVQGDQVPVGERVDYWYTNQPDQVVWAPMYMASDGTTLFGQRRTIRPGEQVRLTWNKGPLAPAGAAPYLDSSLFETRWTGRTTDTVCAACRQDDNGIFAPWPYGDSSPGHFGTLRYGEPEMFSFDFYRDGLLTMTSRSLPAQSFAIRELLLPMAPEAADYRLEWAVSHEQDLLARSHTNWTFRSSRSDPAAALPPGAICAPDSSRGCSLLPLLFLRYDLPIDFESRAPAGAPFELAFHVEHQQHQPAPAGVTAEVSVSFDSGVTWSEPVAATDRGSGRFTTTVTHPALAATDGFVALRVQARDAAGNTVDQSITRAYGLAG